MIMKTTMKSKAIALALAAMTAFSAAAMLTGCSQQDKTASAALYSDRHNVGASPEWVTKLDAAKDAGTADRRCRLRQEHRLRLHA